MRTEEERRTTEHLDPVRHNNHVYGYTRSGSRKCKAGSVVLSRSIKEQRRTDVVNSIKISRTDKAYIRSRASLLPISILVGSCRTLEREEKQVENTRLFNCL